MAGDDDQTDGNHASTEVQGDATTGGNKNGMASAPTSMDETNLPSDFQDGLEAVRERYTPVVPITTRGNDVLLSFSEWDLEGANRNYDQDTCEAYMLVDSGFPSCDPHWIITTPAVTVNGNQVGQFPDRSVFTKEHSSHGDKAEFVRKEVNAKSALAFSWRWSKVDMTPTEPEHLKWAPTMIESALKGDN